MKIYKYHCYCCILILLSIFVVGVVVCAAVCRSVVFFCSWQCMKTPLFGVYKPQKVEFQLYFCCVFFGTRFCQVKKISKISAILSGDISPACFLKNTAPLKKHWKKNMLLLVLSNGRKRVLFMFFS